MLIDLFPRAHARYASLPLLGPQMDGFAQWLADKGLSTLSIRNRIFSAPRLEEILSARSIHCLGELSQTDLLKFGAAPAADDSRQSALVRSLANYLDERAALARPVPPPSQRLADTFRDYLGQVRGLADATAKRQRDTALALLEFLEFDHSPATLRALGPSNLEAFVKVCASRRSRASLLDTVSRLRSFLRFLASRGEIAVGLDTSIDLPRVYRGECLPKALPWEAVQAFLAAIDRSTPGGRRDYAMFLLMTTYGLRAAEVAALQLDGIDWRAAKMRIQRPKTRCPILLPLTDEVGTALLLYLRHARPSSRRRAVFLRLRRPFDPVAAGTVRQAFRERAQRSVPDLPFHGAHCLRHSLAMHLLRRGTSLGTIGDLLGHRSPESTAIYLRLHAEDLRDASLTLPGEPKEIGQ